MVRIRIERGARAGDVLDLEGDAIRIGRHADAELRLDPDRDLSASSHHAALFRDRGRWMLRDLGSTNGTFVNDVRIPATVEIRPGDRVMFGVDGPVIEVVSMDDEAGPSRTQVVRARLHRENRWLRWTAVGLAAALLLSVSLIVAARRDRTALETERTLLLGRIDNLLVSSEAAVASLQGEVGGLADALRQSQEDVRETRLALERAGSSGNGETVERLSRQLRSATEALTRRQLAASLDYRAIERANRSAVTMVYVEADDGTVATATGFAVRADGLVLTAGHVLAGADGTRTPRRIAVQFTDSEQVFPARFVARADNADLALIQVRNLEGTVPVVAGFNPRTDTVTVGSPVAAIGYPLGGETAMPSGRGPRIARPLVWAGYVTALSADGIEVRGYGAAGASGSPIFDADGRIVAVLYGGRNGEAGHTLLGVPASAVLAFVESAR
ncbi:MAG: trypsin-like peptidase domain-containing protein [Longimicrobiales bacterium]